jgi:hypothetical protein
VARAIVDGPSNPTRLRRDVPGRQRMPQNAAFLRSFD